VTAKRRGGAASCSLGRHTSPADLGICVRANSAAAADICLETVCDLKRGAANKRYFVHARRKFCHAGLTNASYPTRASFVAKEKSSHGRRMLSTAHLGYCKCHRIALHVYRDSLFTSDRPVIKRDGLNNPSGKGFCMQSSQDLLVAGIGAPMVMS
jgi:hypothetical protein